MCVLYLECVRELFAFGAAAKHGKPGTELVDVDLEGHAAVKEEEDGVEDARKVLSLVFVQA